MNDNSKPAQPGWKVITPEKPCHLEIDNPALVAGVLQGVKSPAKPLGLRIYFGGSREQYNRDSVSGTGYVVINGPCELNNEEMIHIHNLKDLVNLFDDKNVRFSYGYCGTAEDEVDIPLSSQPQEIQSEIVHTLNTGNVLLLSSLVSTLGLDCEIIGISSKPLVILGSIAQDSDSQ